MGLPKLSFADAERIRSILQQKIMTGRKVSEEYKISPSNVSLIRNYHIWRPAKADVK